MPIPAPSKNEIRDAVHKLERVRKYSDLDYQSLRSVGEAQDTLRRVLYSQAFNFTCELCQRGYLQIDGQHYDEGGFIGACTQKEEA